MGEKTTEYVLHLDLVDHACPRVRKLCILRDPRDRVVSFHHQQLRKEVIAPRELSDEDVRRYADRVRREYQGLLGYVGPIHVLSYEALSADGPTVLTALLRHLEVQADPETVSRLLQAGRFETLSGRNRGEADDRSHFRKGIVGEGGRRLTAAQQQILCADLADLTHRVAEKFALNLDGYL